MVNEKERTLEELQEDIDFSREFVARIDADPFLEGDGARFERAKLKRDLEELARRKDQPVQI